MIGKQRLAVVALISATGLVLILAGMRIGASYASTPAQSPTSVPLQADGDVGLAPSSAGPLDLKLQRAQTVTLEPEMNDLMSATWPIRVQDVYYNWPAGATFKLPDDGWQTATGDTSSGPLIITGPVVNPGAQSWIRVTYRTQQSNWLSHVTRSGDRVTATIGASFNGMAYEPLTSTLVYTRYFPPGAALDHWGISHSLAYTASIDPAPTDQSNTGGWARWITNTSSFTGIMVLSDTIFGSDLTITEFAMNPITPLLGHRVYFTVTVLNNSMVAAWRWFATEVYLRAANDAPPVSPYDHDWGTIVYSGSALLRDPRVDDWKVSQLGPGESVTLTTWVTIVAATGSGDMKAYSQADVANVNDPVHYAWFGSNPEGYCDRPAGCDFTTRPEQENNVYTLQDETGNPLIIHITDTFWLDVWPSIWPSSITLKAPAGKTATYYLQVINTGNVTDTYTITYAKQLTWTVTGPLTVGPVRYELPLSPTANVRTFVVQVAVPAGTPEDRSDLVTVTVRSQGDPTQYEYIRLNTISGWYRLYLPAIKKNN